VETPAASIDLHVHTERSEDGEVSPRGVLSLARKLRLRAIAFSDHDTTAAVDEGVALAPRFNLDFLPAVELTSLYRGKDVHILGYLIDWKDAGLLAVCERTRASRFEQARKRVAGLQALGFEIDFDRVVEVAAGRPPTSAILMAVLRENFARRRDERLVPYVEGVRSDSPALNFFLDYFTPGKAVYVPVETIDAAGAIEVIRAARGLPVLAHPGRLPLELAEAVVRLGMEGIEVYSSNHTSEQEALYRDFAAENGLIVTAGSDFHGPGRKTAPLGGLRKGDMEMVESLRERHSRLFA